MKRILILIATLAATATGVWWAVNRLPRATPEAMGGDSTPQAGPHTGSTPQPQRLMPAAPSAGAALMERLPPLGGACGGRCGSDRWDVKTLSDQDRGSVRLVPVDATIEELVALERPAERPSFGRAPPVEVTVFRVRGYLGGWSSQQDDDIHVVLYGLTNQRLSLVTEIPNPECSGVCPSGLGPLYMEARRRLEASLSRPNPEGRPIVLEITGVGFWDRREHANGSAANGMELHPVLQLREVSPD